MGINMGNETERTITNAPTQPLSHATALLIVLMYALAFVLCAFWCLIVSVLSLVRFPFVRITLFVAVLLAICHAFELI